MQSFKLHRPQKNNIAPLEKGIPDNALPTQKGYQYKSDEDVLREYRAGKLKTNEQTSKTVAVLLAIFLGGLGAHKFYLRQTGLGVLYLLFCWTYIPALLGLFEGIALAMYTQENFNKRFN